jgi:nucleoside-diphosphate-sugar epimerase
LEEQAMSLYLVTGGAGFIGSNIVEELVKRQEKVRVLDNLSTGKKENIIHLVDKIEFIEGDIRNYELMNKITNGVDYIIHQAALPSVSRSIREPLLVNEVNIGGTLNVLFAAKENKVKRVVYASSSSVYGDTPVMPKKEDFHPAPLSPYAVTKLTGEHYCQVFYRVYGLQTVALRYFNVFGPHQDPASEYAAVIPRFITAMLAGKSPTVYGDGLQSRDFTYVDNVVAANLNSCTSLNAAGKIMNIACGERTPLIQLLTEINTILGTQIIPVFDEARKGDVKHSLADIAQAYEFIDYSPRVKFKSGLKKTVDWFKANYTGN